MKKTPEPKSSADTSLWRQAIEICESLAGLERSEVLSKLASMQLAPQLLDKIQRIMDNMSASNPLLDQHDYQSLIDNLKNGQHLIGQTIDGYVIKRLIAKGGMSTVYEASYTQAKHQKSVAIKLLSPYGITDKTIELFNREQLILSKLSHPSIVAFHHSGVTADGTHYLVMEYIQEAENLVDYAAKHKLSNQAIVNQIKGLCEVFSYAHDQQIIHRDIKPANILVDSSGQVKVIDFGIGRLEQLGSQTVTQVFTPDAAAPEQLMGQGVSQLTDVFSLGALLLQLLVKQKPLPKTNIKTYDPHQDSKHINKLLKASDLDNDLKNIITSAMHIDPKQRYSSMKSFADDLNNWLNHKPVLATADTFWYRCKKLYSRNKSISLLVIFGVLVSVLAVTVITTQGYQNQKVTSQRDGSFALIEAMIKQANPITNNNRNIDSDALVDNLNELAKSQAELLASDTELSHFFHKELGSLYHSKGLYDESLSSYLKAFESLQKMVDEEDDQYLSTALTIAHLYETTGKFKLAQSTAEDMLVKLDQLPDVDPRHRLNTYYLLSKVHQYQAQNDISQHYGKLATAWLQQYPDIDPALQASVYNSLAVTNRNMGNSELAETQYNQAIELLTPIKEKQIELSSILVNFAILKGRSGDMSSSEEIFNRAFEIIKRIDENHPHLAMAYLPYTTLLQFTDRMAESEHYIKEAIKILTDTGEEKYLATAHMKYARIGLYTNQVDDTLVHVTKSYVLYKEITGEDHPIIYDLYNMALWVLLLEPYQDYAQQLTQIIANKPVDNAKESREYKRFLVQQAWINQQTLEQDFAESVFPNFMFKADNQSSTVEQLWLLQMQEIYGGSSDVVDAWLAINLAINQNDQETIKQLCDIELKWFDSSRLAERISIVEQCLNHSTHIEDATLEVFTQLVEDTSKPNENRLLLIERLINAMQ